ncbi:MAG: hypothetical protein II800_10640 [Lachnospiraceae bacterium]|nr:hypothetical protein [Lachnospiraceae bacterium]
MSQDHTTAGEIDNQENVEKKEKAEKTTRRKTKRTREQIEEREKQKDNLKKQQAELTKDLEEHQAEQKKLGDRSAMGMVISHKKFGRGKVTKEDGKYIEVTFDKLKKTFVLPGAIAGGFLIPEEQELIEYYKKAEAVHERIQKTDLALRSNRFSIERIDEQIEKLNERA